MLTEIMISLAIVCGLFAMSYPSIEAVKESIEEQAEIQRIIRVHNDNYAHCHELPFARELNGVWYFPNGTVKPHTFYTKKHKIVIGKYNTVRVEKIR